MRIDRQAGTPVGAPYQLFGADAGVIQGLVIEFRPESAGLQVDIFMAGGDMQAGFVKVFPPSALDAGVFKNDGNVRVRGGKGMGP